MTRIVPDTNIVVSGLLWRGNPRRILDAARDGIIKLYTSPVLLAELEDVLSREKFARRLATANVTVQDLVSGFSALATVIEAEPIEPVILVDPDDDAVLACLHLIWSCHSPKSKLAHRQCCHPYVPYFVPLLELEMY